MRTKEILKTITLIVFISLISTQNFAGTTGKIAGKIIDAATGEPLIGANIIIMGTTLGCCNRF